MTEHEWTDVAALIDAWWPATDFTEDSEAAYFVELQRFDRDEVEWAVRAMLLEGGAFAPSLTQLLRQLEVRDDELPTFRQAWNRIARSLRRHGLDESGVLAELAAEHAIIVDFVSTYGFRELAEEQVDDPTYGGAAMTRIERTWNEHVRHWTMRRRMAGVERSQLAAGARRSGQLTAPSAFGEIADRVAE